MSEQITLLIREGLTEELRPPRAAPPPPLPSPPRSALSGPPVLNTGYEHRRQLPAALLTGCMEPTDGPPHTTTNPPGCTISKFRGVSWRDDTNPVREMLSLPFSRVTDAPSPP